MNVSGITALETGCKADLGKQRIITGNTSYAYATMTTSHCRSPHDQKVDFFEDFFYHTDK